MLERASSVAKGAYDRVRLMIQNEA